MRLGPCTLVSGVWPPVLRFASARLAHLAKLPLSDACRCVHLPPRPAGASSPSLACLADCVLPWQSLLQGKPRPLRVWAQALQLLQRHPRASLSLSGTWKVSVDLSGCSSCQALALSFHLPRLPLSDR